MAADAEPSGVWTDGIHAALSGCGGRGSSKRRRLRSNQKTGDRLGFCLGTTANDQNGTAFRHVQSCEGVLPEPERETHRYFDYFKRLDFGTVYPLVMALYEDYTDGQFALGEFVSCMALLHSFIVRRMVVGVPSNSLSGLFISLCKAKPVTETPSSWLSACLAQEDKNRRWPSDSEFGDAGLKLRCTVAEPAKSFSNVWKRASTIMKR